MMDAAALTITPVTVGARILVVEDDQAAREVAG